MTSYFIFVPPDEQYPACGIHLFASLFLFFKALKNSKNHGFSAAVFPFSGLPRALLLTIAAVFPLYGQPYYTPQYFL
jgi:hypothetical protein